MSDMPETKERKKNNTTLIVVIVVVAALLLLCCCVTILAANAVGVLSWFQLGPVRITESWQFPRTEAETTFERTFDDLETPVSIVVENQVGKVRVVGTDALRVVVRATARAYGSTQTDAQNNLDRVTVSADQSSPSRIVVRSEFPRVTFAGRSPQVEFTIEVPVRSSVDVTTKVGEVQVTNLEGQARLQTDVGDVNVREFRGALDANADVGDVDVYTWTMRDDSRLSTGVGKIQVRLVGDPSFNLVAETNVGKIDCDFAVQGEQQRDLRPGGTLKGTVGENPDIDLTLRTNTGAITILRAR